MSTARERLLDTAERCFEEQGINATGVNELVERADVARMTLYNNFSSKDELVAAYLQRRSDRWLLHIDEQLEDTTDVDERPLVVIREYGWRTRHDGFRGCVFINAAAELPDDHPGWTAIREHKRSVRQLLHDLVAETGAPAPPALADGLFLLAEGAIAAAGVQRSHQPLDYAVHTARTLLDHARRQPDTGPDDLGNTSA